MPTDFLQLQKRRRERGLPSDGKDLSMLMWLEDLQDHYDSEGFEDDWRFGLDVIARMQDAGNRFLAGDLLAYIDGIPELADDYYI